MSNVQTAYLKEMAYDYDQKRFATRSGQLVHRIESNLLKCALGCVTLKASLLEVGCGTGRLLFELTNEGYRIDGTDASLDMLTICNKKSSKSNTRSKFCLSEAAKLPYADGSYDFVYSIRLLNQTESPEYAMRVIKEMIRVTKTNGFLLVECMNQHRPPGKKIGNKDVLLRPENVKAYTTEGLVELIWFRGAFGLPMGVFHRAPVFTLGFLKLIDQALGSFFPELCTRCYFLMRKL